MKNNDKWSQLSMQQRADLIKLYVESGITDLRDIKKDYNSFSAGGRILDGTETEQTLSGKKPTLEDYLQHKRDSTRNAALEKSYTRTKGILIPYAFGEGEREKVEEQLVIAAPYATRFTYGPFTAEQEEFDTKNANYFLGNYYQAKKELEDNCKYGFNCIGTATDNYPDESRTNSNKDFDQNFDKYGFAYVGMDNAKPGDIAKTSSHGMIYVGKDANGNPLFNYSDGGITEYNYKKNAKYPADYYGVYTYVGTPELIQQWTEEYNNKKSHVGRILDGTSEKNQNLSNTPIFDPQKIIENVPAREFGPQRYTEEGDFIAGPGTNIIAAPLQYHSNKGFGKENIEFAKQIMSDFESREDKQKHIDEDSDYYKSYLDAKYYLDHVEALKKYLKLPYNTSIITESDYKPTRLQNSNKKTYKFTSETDPKHWKLVVEDMLRHGQNKKQYIDPVLNNFTAYRDFDDKGDFISVYDEWDYTPKVKGGGKTGSAIINKATGGEPFIIYDRIYLDDYYNIPEEFRGNPYITPAVVTETNAFMESEYKKGGKLTKMCK